ncbi:MAG: energy-coupling factor transporter transmembrane component T family protein [Anaerolineae bacterium]
MQDFAYLRHLTLGQYLPRQSVIHALDPRVKLIGLAALAVAITVNASYTANVVLLAATLALAVGARISPLSILRGLAPAAPVIVLFAAIQVVFYRSGYGPTTVPRPVLTWGPLVITDAGIRAVIISLARLVQLWLLTSLLTNTTPISTLARGVEALLQPLSRLGFPGHELSLVFTVALRFLPVFALELEDVMKAQVSRGVDWQVGRLAFIRNSRRVASLLIPLFAAALRRAEELATAMEARCYTSGRGRTHMLALSFRGSDWFALALTLLFSVIFVVARNWFAW